MRILCKICETSRYIKKCPLMLYVTSFHKEQIQFGLFHLKSIHPLWKILENCTTGGVNFQIHIIAFFMMKMITEKSNVIFKLVSNEIFLKYLEGVAHITCKERLEFLDRINIHFGQTLSTIWSEWSKFRKI